MSVRRAAGCALAGAGLVLIGFMFDSAPLFVPGVAFVALGVAAPAWVWLAARQASVERRIEEDRVIEGDPLEAWLELRGGPFGLPGGELRDPLAGTPMRLPRGRRASVRVLARFERRGLRQLPPPSVRVRDPLELAECTCLSTSPPQDVLVLPRTEPVQWARAGGAGTISRSSRTRAELLAAVEVDGLRPYRPGTPASRIHWSALARGAGLLERRLRVDGDTLPLVVLDARGSGPQEHLDAAVRAAASLTHELARVSGCRLLLPGSRRAIAIETDLASWPIAHARLALVEGGVDAKPPSPAAVRAALGPLIYVTSQPLDRLPSALGREAASASSATLVVPEPLALGGRRASFVVSGCAGFALAGRSRLAREPSLPGEAVA
jgi:uncharacterized protein (DUF58 family)